MSLQKIDNLFAGFLLSISALIFFFVALNSVVHYEGSESLNHYFIAESVFQEPLFLLDHWGKPLFTLLASPFSYFGSKGVMIFNCLVMLFSAVIAFFMSKKLGAKLAFPVVVFILFAPVYYKFSQSCLTEPLFGLVALLSAFFFHKKYFIFSSILISFIIFSRTEGVLFIPIYAFALIVKKQYKAIPFLAFGFIFYSFLGSILDKEVWWFIYEYPYSSVVSFYGKGPFLHWFTNQKDITGTPFSIFIVLSFFIIVINSFWKIKESISDKNLVLVYLIVLPASIYILGHSFLWYKGWSSSVGLYRIVGGVIPLMGIMAIVGLNRLFSFVLNFYQGKVVLVSVMLICSFLVISNTFKGKTSLIFEKPNDISKLIQKSNQWIKDSKLEYNNLYVFKTEYFEYFGVNPYIVDKSYLRKTIHNRLAPQNELVSGDVVIWDGQTTPNEGGIPVIVLDTNQAFETIKEFRPEHEFKVLGDGYYYIKLFRRK